LTYILLCKIIAKESVDETDSTAVAAAVPKPLTSDNNSEIYSPAHADDFPPLEIPSSTMIIIAEESAEASTGMDLYRGTVESAGEDADNIIDVAPTWLLSYLLYVSLFFLSNYNPHIN
jgi:WD repeat-containing protein 48